MVTLGDGASPLLPLFLAALNTGVGVGGIQPDNTSLSARGQAGAVSSDTGLSVRPAPGCFSHGGLVCLLSFQNYNLHSPTGANRSTLTSLYCLGRPGMEKALCLGLGPRFLSQVCGP